MKKRMYLMGAIALGLSCLGSCSDDDDGLDLNKSVTVYGEQYELGEVIAWESNPYVLRTTVPYIFEDTYTNGGGETVTDEVVGFIEGEGSNEYGNFMLSFYERGMEYNEQLARITGKGICLSCHLVSPEKDRLVPGKYVFNTECTANTFVAYFSSEYDPEGYVTPSIISEGDVTVEENGENCRIKFRCKNDYGSEVSGIYEGVLRQVRINQQVSASYNDIMLSGLMRYVHVKNSSLFWGDTESDALDTYGNAFFSSATGDCRTAAGNKENVDVALIWDRDNNYFRFESPIRMRAMLGHSDNYNFPCHTIYAWAPDSFTGEDFENLDKTGFTFDLENGSEVIFRTEPFKEGYVFFKTGKGTKGVIHVKDFTLMGSQTSNSIFGSSTWETAPKLVMDVKSEASFPNPIMR